MAGLATALLPVVCGSGVAADQEYYRRYLREAGTNDQLWKLTSPLLVDTNNVGYKLTNVVLHLEELKETGAMAGVRPGMTMEEVVRKWGKPLEVWCKGFSGPRFCYKEVSVFFDPRTNSVSSVYTHKLSSLMSELHRKPDLEACLNALGLPDHHETGTGGARSFLVYITTNAVLKICCVRGRLESIQMDKPPD